jgi:hypothetical protein
VTARRLALFAACVIACDRGDETPVPEPTPVIVDVGSGTNAQPEPIATPAPAVRAGAYVVVRGGAQLFASVDATTPAITLPTGVAMAVVGQSGDRIALETPPASDRWAHCSDEPTGWRGLRLSLFVAHDGLAQVTTRTIVHRFADGSSVELDAGAVVTGSGDDRVIDAAGWRVRAPIPDDVLGERYDPTGPRVLGSPLGRVPQRDLAGEAASRVEADAQGFATIAGDPAVFARRSDDGQTHHEVRGRCASLWIAVPGVQAASEEAQLAASTIPPIRGPRHEVAEGTAITWEDGRAAGLVVARREVGGVAIERDDRKCFGVPIVDGAAEQATLCFAKSGLRELEASHEPDVAPPLVAVAPLTEAPAVDVLPPGTPPRPVDLVPVDPPPSVAVVPITPAATTTPRASAKIGTADIHGSVDATELAALLDKRLGAVRRCYAKALATNPTLAGKLEVRLTIDIDGSIRNADVRKSTLADATLEACVRRAIRKIKLAAPLGGGLAVIDVPITLAPS